MTVRTALQQATKILENEHVAAARLTAEVLLAHAMRRERSYLYAHPEQDLTQIEWIHYGRYLTERTDGKPTQYITGKQEFFGREFRVTPDVLIPRPETEHAVETVLEVASQAKTIVDAGCGSGAIAVTLALETRAHLCGTDISAAALAVASENALRLKARVDWLVCDLLSAVRDGSVDTVVSNPPYVPSGDQTYLQREVRDYEPGVALFAGPTGFEIYERIIRDAERVLRPEGWLVLELGYNSSHRVSGMLGARWQEPRITPDLAGIPRVLAARLMP